MFFAAGIHRSRLIIVIFSQNNKINVKLSRIHRRRRIRNQRYASEIELINVLSYPIKIVGYMKERQFIILTILAIACIHVRIYHHI